MNHYTYMITVKNPTDARRLYLGVRSCKVIPEEDFYFGSCKPFRAWQKQHGTGCLEKQVLAVWPTREEALSHEILLHDCFDVAANPEFWNQAKQTAEKFDTSGTTHIAYNKGMKWTDEQKKRLSQIRKGRVISEETRIKISQAQKGRKMPEERRLKLVGKKASEETRLKQRLAKLGKTTWSKGKKFSDEHRANLSAAKMGVEAWNKNRAWTDKEKEKLSEAAKNRKVDRQRNEKGQYL